MNGRPPLNKGGARSLEFDQLPASPPEGGLLAESPPPRGLLAPPLEILLVITTLVGLSTTTVNHRPRKRRLKYLSNPCGLWWVGRWWPGHVEHRESAPRSRGADGRECVGHRVYGVPLGSAPRSRRRTLLAPSVPPSHNARRGESHQGGPRAHIFASSTCVAQHEGVKPWPHPTRRRQRGRKRKYISRNDTVLRCQVHEG